MFFTIGHSSVTWADFVDNLKAHNIDCLVDVRSYPGSRRVPHFSKETMGIDLAPSSIDYYHIPKLGGRRRKLAVQPDVNAWWTHQSFHNYADYAQTSDFAEGMRELLSLENTYARIAYMCSESVWWKCHRRIITDYLIAAGHPVHHIIGAKVSLATINEAAICCDGNTLRYPGPQTTLAL